MGAISGFTLGARLIEILGLKGQQVYNIEIKVAVDDAVRVTVEKFVTSEEAGEIVKVLSEYKLCRAESEGL